MPLDEFYNDMRKSAQKHNLRITDLSFIATADILLKDETSTVTRVRVDDLTREKSYWRKTIGYKG